MKIDLKATKYSQLKDKTFEIIKVREKLCEFCKQLVEKEEISIDHIKILDPEDYEKLLIRTKAHERAEVDLEKNSIYLYDYTYPLIFHSDCLEKYAKRKTA